MSSVKIKYAVQSDFLFIAISIIIVLITVPMDLVFGWHANLGISDQDASEINRNNPDDPQITIWKNAMQNSIAKHKICFDTSLYDKSFIQSCEYLIRQDYENCVSHPGVLLACMDPRISQFLEQVSEFKLSELRNLTNGSDIIFNQSLAPVKEWSEYSDANLGLNFEYPAGWLVTLKSNPALKESLIKITSPFDPRSITIFEYTHPFDVSTVGVNELAKIALESATDNSSNTLVEPIDLKKYQIDGQPTATLLVSTKNSQPPFYMFMEQIVVTFKENKSYRLGFSDLSDSFNAQKGTMDHLFNSIKFIK
jgi:hypothetical protein